MSRWTSWLGLLLIPVVAVGAHCALVETSGEVVVLTTMGTDRVRHETRVWVVDMDGQPWIQAGSSDASWLEHIEEHSEVEVLIRGERKNFKAVQVPEARARILELMAAKYGLADRWVRFMVGSEPIPIRLDLAP